VAPLALAPTGVAATVTGPTPPSATLPARASQVFVWTLVPSGTGTLALDCGASGLDGNTAAALAPAAAGTASIRVQEPAAIELAILSAPARVNVGQPFDVTVRATNRGEADARDVLVDVAVPGATAGAAPASVLVPGGAARDVVRRFTVGSAGTATATATLAGGVDATDARPLTALAVTRAVAVDTPAALQALLAAPSLVAPGELTVTLTVTNTGDAVATGVLPVAPPAVVGGSTSTPTLVASGGNAPATLARGEQATFSWTYLASALGVAQLAADASGIDRNDGATRTATAPVLTVQIAEVGRLVQDPLGGSAFSFVFAHGGLLWLGPSQHGSGAVRCDAARCAGTAEPVAFSFARDVTGTVSRNKSPPYTSLGFTGCVPDSSGPTACGPDNEDGRGYFASGTLGGQEWILAAGARSGGDLNYVYMASTVSVGTASFSYVDLSRYLGGATRGFSSALFFNDRLYLGFPDNGGSRPYGVVLTAPPTPPGLDANAEGFDLGMHATALGVNTGAILMIDTWAAFGGRVYAFNQNGCVVSVNGAPAAAADFVVCTPSAAAWTGATSEAAARMYDLTPADRAIPQAALWGGRLYIGRNTTAGPQLWACDPARSGDAAVCDPADWSIVAASGLVPAGSSRITAVAATSAALYVAFDHPAGAQLYRTSAPTPAVAGDFRGAGGCVVGAGACDGIGGAGLGAGSTAALVLDARALDVGGRIRLYVSAGDGTRPISVWEIQE
jgi:hypothetical protein